MNNLVHTSVKKEAEYLINHYTVYVSTNEVAEWLEKAKAVLIPLQQDERISKANRIELAGKLAGKIKRAKMLLG